MSCTTTSSLAYLQLAHPAALRSVQPAPFLLHFDAAIEAYMYTASVAALTTVDLLFAHVPTNANPVDAPSRDLYQAGYVV